MSNSAAKIFFILGATALLVVTLFLFRPAYFNSSSGLTLLIGAEILLAAACNYRKAFLPLLLICFLVAGTGLPFRFELLQARWGVLGVGASLGLAVYIKRHRQKLTTFHLLASFCALSGFVSAFVSAYPSESLLKAASLFLLLLYVSTGARTAVGDDPRAFFLKLLRGAEILLVATVCLYFVFHWEIFGNPNSLGALMAVAVVPLLLWGYLSAQSQQQRLRLGVELVFAIVLLLGSFARAAIVASAVSSLLICLSLNRVRLIIKGAAVVAVLSAVVVFLIPRQYDNSSADTRDSLVTTFLYKGKPEQGVFGSRKGVWEQTWKVVRENPWFGSGFGTSSVTEDLTKMEYAQHHIDSWVVREHGNSYLALLEWTGLLGVLPFYGLVFIAVLNVRSVFLWVRQTRDVLSPAIPAAAIVVAGLIDAAFEDWLLAVGYYLCIFFWVIAFILVDVMPERQTVYLSRSTAPLPDPLFSDMAPAR